MFLFAVTCCSFFSIATIAEAIGRLLEQPFSLHCIRLPLLLDGNLEHFLILIRDSIQARSVPANWKYASFSMDSDAVSRHHHGDAAKANNFRHQFQHFTDFCQMQLCA